VVGPGTGVFSTSDGNGAVVRRGGAANFVNGIIARWPGVGLSIRDNESKTLLDDDSLYVRNVYLVQNGSNFEAVANGRFGSVVKDSAAVWKVTEAQLADVFTGDLPTKTTTVSTSNLNLALKTGAAAATAGLGSFAGTPLAGRVTSYFGGTMAGTAYVGAVDPASSARWYEGWTTWVRN